jgi:hypothetical protein
MCRRPLECASGHVSVGARLLHVSTSLRLCLPEVVCGVWEAGSGTRRVGLPPQFISSNPRTAATAGCDPVENDRHCSVSSSKSGHAAFRAPHAWRILSSIGSASRCRCGSLITRAAYSFKFTSFITLCCTFRCFCTFSFKNLSDLDISRRIENPTLAARRVVWSATLFALGAACLAFAVTVSWLGAPTA